MWVKGSQPCPGRLLRAHAAALSRPASLPPLPWRCVSSRLVLSLDAVSRETQPAEHGSVGSS